MSTAIPWSHAPPSPKANRKIVQILTIMTDFFSMATQKYLAAREQQHAEVMAHLAGHDFKAASQSFQEHSLVTYDTQVSTNRVAARQKMLEIYSLLERDGTISAVTLKAPNLSNRFDGAYLKTLSQEKLLERAYNPIDTIVPRTMAELPNLTPNGRHSLEFKVNRNEDLTVSPEEWAV